MQDADPLVGDALDTRSHRYLGEAIRRLGVLAKRRRNRHQEPSLTGARNPPAMDARMSEIRGQPYRPFRGSRVDHSPRGSALV